MELVIRRVDDFEPNGLGDSQQWDNVDWQNMSQVGNVPSPYSTRCKVAYSGKGIYFLVECEDRRLTCTEQQDMGDIYREDVVEAFLWPDEKQDLYFEYEISPMNKELVLLIPNHNGVFMGWTPWHYEDERKIKKAVTVSGGEQKPGSEVDGWTAEFFVPFALFKGLGNTPPVSGTRWRGNVYRIDYDFGPMSQWEWCPKTGRSFHNYKEFGTFIFE